jgi:multiple sugar transport system permease protein
MGIRGPTATWERGRGRAGVRLGVLALKRKQWEPFAFASPALALIGLVILFPLGYSFYLSLQNYDLSVGNDYQFVGAQNYTEALFHDARFVNSIWNTVLIIVPTLVFQLLLGLGLALLLGRVLRGRPIITALLAIPTMVSPVMAAMAWRMLFGVKYGAINNLGRQLGLLTVYFDWFSSPLLSLCSIILVETWHHTSFMMLVLLAGLQSIPQELYEAAKADGATPWQRFWYITLPLLKFTMAVAVMIRLIDLTKLFGLIFVLTYGGPGGSTETMAFTTYLAGFSDFRMSYAAALSYVIVAGVLILTMVFVWIQRLREARTA